MYIYIYTHTNIAGQPYNSMLLGDVFFREFPATLCRRSNVSARRSVTCAAIRGSRWGSKGHSRGPQHRESAKKYGESLGSIHI